MEPGLGILVLGVVGGNISKIIGKIEEVLVNHNHKPAAALCSRTSYLPHTTDVSLEVLSQTKRSALLDW